MPYEPHPLLDFDGGVGQRAESVKFTLTDKDRSPIGELTPVIDTSIPTVTWDIGAKIKRQMANVVLLHSDYAQVNPFLDLVRPEWVLEDGSRFAVGSFHFTGDPKTRMSVNLTSMGDGTVLIDQPTTYTFGLPQGGNLGSLMRQVCYAVGLSDTKIDPTKFNAGEPIMWPAGTTYLQILEDLCALAGFFPPHFDRFGTLKMIRATPLSRTKTTFPGDRLVIQDSAEYNSNLMNIPNTHVVIGNGPGNFEIVTESAVDPSLPWSIEKSGRKIIQIHMMQGIESNQQAVDMAARFAQVAPKDYAEVSFNTPPDPRHDVFETIEVRGAIYREVSWSLPLKAGSVMNHRAAQSGAISVGGGSSDPSSGTWR